MKKKSILKNRNFNAISTLLLAAGLILGITEKSSIIQASSVKEEKTFLTQNFLTPPKTARPGVYWYFMDGNISKEGMTRDLEAMNAAGIGYLGGKYYEYIPMDQCYVWQVTKKRRYIGPTRLEVSLVWLIGRGNYNKDKGGRR